MLCGNLTEQNTCNLKRWHALWEFNGAKYLQSQTLHGLFHSSSKWNKGAHASGPMNRLEGPMNHA